MRRYLMIATVLTWMAFPMLAGAEGVVIPPAANWTRHPPAQQTIDAAQLTEILVQKGIITRQEAAQLMQPQAFTSGGGGRWMVRGVTTSVLTSP